MALRLKDIIAGNTRAVNTTFTAVDGSPHNLTGATIAFTARDSNNSSVITLDNNANANQVVIVSATNGQVRIVLSGTNTTLAAGTYNFGVQATLADGTILEDTGKFKIKPQYVE